MYKYILTMVDHFSRYRWTAALQNKLAVTVLRELRQWWSIFGKPDILQSDNGTEFVAAQVKELCRRWGVQKRRSRPYKPSTNGSVERANRDIQERLARWLTRNPGKGWVEGLIPVTQAHNHCWTRCHKSKPVEVFKMPPSVERVLQPDESMLPVQDHSEDETDTEADQVYRSVDDDSQEETESEDDGQQLPQHGGAGDLVPGQSEEKLIAQSAEQKPERGDGQLNLQTESSGKGEVQLGEQSGRWRTARGRRRRRKRMLMMRASAASSIH